MHLEAGREKNAVGCFEKLHQRSEPNATAIDKAEEGPEG
jgi:hypothetical protein